MSGKTRVVIQSRLSSTRLPGKAMLTVGGMPMVTLAALRAGNSGAEVVVATSDRVEDDVIESAVTSAGVRVVRGPLDDPLARFALAAEGLSSGDAVVRLTGDNVFPDGDLVSLLVRRLRELPSAYVRLGGDDPALPYGVAAEAFTYDALSLADELAESAHEREHVTPWMRREYGDIRIAVPGVKAHWFGLRCTVDGFEDYVRTAQLFARVPEPISPSWRELCDLMTRDERPPVSQSRIILGAVQLGLAYGPNTEGLMTEDSALRILSTAAEERITHVDTARAYGLSEERIGTASGRGLAGLGVVTKVVPLGEVPVGKARGAVLESVATSLRTLQSDHVDALLLHRHADWALSGNAARDALVEMREARVCGVIGTSLSTPAELVDALTDPECGYVQLPFNILDQRWLSDDVQGALAERDDVIVTCRSVFLQGLLVLGDAARWPSNNNIDPVELVKTIEALRAELGRDSAADLCLAYVLGQDWVTSAVVGADTAAQIQELAALARAAPLTTEQITLVRDRIGPMPETLLDPSRWRTDG